MYPFCMLFIPDSIECSFLSILIFYPIDCVQELTIVLPSLDTITLTMGSTVFLVIMVPRIQTELVTQGSKWVQGVSQNDFIKCNTKMMASNHFSVIHGVPQRI